MSLAACGSCYRLFRGRRARVRDALLRRFDSDRRGRDSRTSLRRNPARRNAPVGPGHSKLIQLANSGGRFPSGPAKAAHGTLAHIPFIDAKSAPRCNPISRRSLIRIVDFVCHGGAETRVHSERVTARSCLRSANTCSRVLRWRVQPTIRTLDWRGRNNTG